jgi:chemotaxis response regulator CheB
MPTERLCESHLQHATAGGLEAFTQLLGALPLDTGRGFVLVQHLDPDHESQLVQILSRTTLGTTARTPP